LLEISLQFFDVGGLEIAAIIRDKVTEYAKVHIGIESDLSI
jgi:hypothetical protein